MIGFIYIIIGGTAFWLLVSGKFREIPYILGVTGGNITKVYPYTPGYPILRGPDGKCYQELPASGGGVHQYPVLCAN